MKAKKKSKPDWVLAIEEHDVSRLKELSFDPNHEQHTVKVQGQNRLKFTRSPIGYAIEEDDVESLKVILEKGGDPSQQCLQISGGLRDDWRSPIGHALCKRNMEALRMLIEAGANIRDNCYQQRSKLSKGYLYTPLQLAKRNPNPEALQIVLDALKGNSNSSSPEASAPLLSDLKDVSIAERQCSCGQVVQDDNDFCGKCGSKI